MTSISHPPPGKCNRFFLTSCGSNWLLTKRGPRGNPRGDFQHCPGLLPPVRGCIVETEMNRLMEEVAKQVQLTVLLPLGERNYWKK
jgi:hypothetical protein